MAWNKAADRHVEYFGDRLFERFSDPGFCCLQPYRKEALLKHGLESKSVVQPACNREREIISIKNLGAGRCVGIDLSEKSIEQGKKLA